MNRITEQITVQISEMTSSMLEHIFSIKTGKMKKAAVREEVMKEIGSEMLRFQKRFEESRELISTMRKQYLKEISHLRALSEANQRNIQNQGAVS